MIKEILTKCGVAILISVVSLVVGIALGFQLKEDKNGVYLFGQYPDGTSMFKLGNSSVQLAELELQDLEQRDIYSLLSKLETLPVKSRLGSSLRRIALDGSGPFIAIPISVKINLVDEASIQGPIAKACKNSPVYENPILAYQAISTDSLQTTIPVKGLLGINVRWEHISDCKNSGGIPEIWASKAYVRSWINSGDFNDSSITVKAKMIVSSIGI